MPRKPVKTKETIKEAILQSHGVVLNVARALDVRWETASKYIHKWPDLEALFKAQGQKVTDLAENNVIDQIEAGEAWATKFWLTTRGRDRGFGEHQEIEQVGEINVKVKIEH